MAIDKALATKARTGTIQIFVPTKTFRFQNPSVAADVLLSEPTQDIVNDAFFTTEPGKLQNAPAWIQDDLMFKWALQENAIAVVNTGNTVSESKLTADEQAQRAASEKAKEVANSTTKAS